MNVEQNGNLALHCIDLEGWDEDNIEESRNRLVKREIVKDVSSYRRRAQIAIWFARQVNSCRIRFSARGLGVNLTKFNFTNY